MKKVKLITFTLLTIFSLYSFGQTKEISSPHEIKISELSPDDNQAPAGVFKLDNADSANFQLKISDVDTDKKNEIENYTIGLVGGDDPTKLSKGPGKYQNDNKIYEIDWSTVIGGFSNNWKRNDNTTVAEIKSDKGLMYSFTIKLNTTDSNSDPNTLTKTETQIAIQRYFDSKIYDINNNESRGRLKLKLERNALVDDNDIIHLYMDLYGKFYGPGIPTAATQDNRFQFHILLAGDQNEDYEFDALYTGEYQPEVISIFNTKESVAEAAKAEKNKGLIYVNQWDGAIKGPYTSQFSVEITASNGDSSQKVVDAKIKIAKLYHVSISTGLLFSTLKNPKNIETFTKANGETTLIADDPSDRGMLTIMATFYPKGRSFLFPLEGFQSRYGFQIGTKLDDNLTENFFAGLSFDFARGGTFSTGAHYGRRNYVAGADDFDFGEDLFDLPELNVKKEWEFGLYVGVVIDTKVALELIKSLTGSN